VKGFRGRERERLKTFLRFTLDSRIFEREREILTIFQATYFKPLKHIYNIYHALLFSRDWTNSDIQIRVVYYRLKKERDNMLSLRVYLFSVFTILLGMTISNTKHFTQYEKNKLLVAYIGLVVLILLFRSDFIFASSERTSVSSLSYNSLTHLHTINSNDTTRTGP